jgi:predicted HTH transcriptional regulator
MKYRIFISSVQREFSAERKAIVELISTNPQLSRFFDTFAFEVDVPAADKRTDEVYLSELAVSDLYVGLVGNEYGGITPDGTSATEAEYDEATRLGIPRFIFVKGKSDKERDSRELAFLRKVSPGLIRVRFDGTDKLLSSLTESLDRFLAENKVAYAERSYEEEPVGKWDELDEEKIRWFVRTARVKRGFPFAEDAPTEKVLTHLKMVTDGVPNRAAMLCFGRNAHLYATSPGVKCVLWYGKERRKPAGSYKWFEGNLFDISDKAIEFIKEKLDLRIGGHTLGAQSDDTFEIDERIVSEMINNGIAHRDYASSATVQVELFKDRLTVFSPGPMHRNMKYELLSEDHQSYAVNPIIAHALFYVQYIEELGTGTVDIFNICKATGLQPPVFDIDAQHFMVTVYRPIFDEQGNRIPIASSEVTVNTSEVGPKATEVGVETPEVGPKNMEVGVETPEIGVEMPEVGPIATEVGPKATEVGVETPEIGVEIDFDKLLAANRKDFRSTCKKVWQLLAINPDLTQVSIASKLRLQPSSVQSACNALKEVGLLVREGARKNGRWIVRTMPDRESNQS